MDTACSKRDQCVCKEWLQCIKVDTVYVKSRHSVCVSNVEVSAACAKILAQAGVKSGQYLCKDWSQRMAAIILISCTRRMATACIKSAADGAKEWPLTSACKDWPHLESHECKEWLQCV